MSINIQFAFARALTAESMKETETRLQKKRRKLTGRCTSCNEHILNANLLPSITDDNERASVNGTSENSRRRRRQRRGSSHDDTADLCFRICSFLFLSLSLSLQSTVEEKRSKSSFFPSLEWVSE